MANIVALYAGILGVIYVPLGVRVAGMRLRYKIGIGDGGNKQLSRAIRIHGNFIEYVPLGLILLFAVEMQGYGAQTVHALGIALVVARLAHIWGLSGSVGVSVGRSGGIVLTWLIILVASVLAILGAVWK